MPFEVVQYPNTTGISGTELSVHWSKDHDGDGNVQLAITNHVWGRSPEPEPDALAHSRPVHSGHNDCVPCAERAEAMKAVGDAPEFGQMMEVDGGSVVGEFDPSVSIVTKPLSRTEINNMIRSLRRARDQAFGKDE
jgi:hypothetical protein